MADLAVVLDLADEPVRAVRVVGVAGAVHAGRPDDHQRDLRASADVRQHPLAGVLRQRVEVGRLDRRRLGHDIVRHRVDRVRADVDDLPERVPFQVPPDVHRHLEVGVQRVHRPALVRGHRRGEDQRRRPARPGRPARRTPRGRSGSASSTRSRGPSAPACSRAPRRSPAQEAGRAQQAPPGRRTARHCSRLSHFIGAACRRGSETNRCQTTAWNASLCAVTVSGLIVGTITQASATFAV